MWSFFLIILNMIYLSAFYFEEIMLINCLLPYHIPNLAHLNSQDFTISTVIE